MKTRFPRICAVLSILTLLMTPVTAITIRTPVFAVEVPDMGSTLALMGIALVGLGFAARSKGPPKN